MVLPNRQLRAEDFPESDGVPMDSEEHAVNIREFLIDPFKLWCRRRSFSAFIGGNSFVYFGQTRKHHVVGPDLYVVNDGIQRSQKSWIVHLEGGLMPTLVMEFMSETSFVEDQTTKLATYRDELRCSDYFLVDGRGDVPPPTGFPVKGFHLQGGVYVPISPDSSGRLACASLPLKVGHHEGRVRWFELDGTILPTHSELRERAEKERERAEEQRERAEEQRERAEEQRERAEEQRQRAEEQRQRAEQEVAELRAEVERLRRGGA